MKMLSNYVLLVVVATVMFGCGSKIKYNVADNFIMPTDAKVGVLEQTKCVNKCTDAAANPKLYSDSLRARLEARLQRPVLLIAVAADADFDYSPEKTAEFGKKAGVDFVVGGRLGGYNDPSSAARSGAMAITVLTAVLPIHIISTTTPAVNAQIEVVRTADAKIVGTWAAGKTGGNFARCTSLTEDIADVIAEKQFGL